MVLFTHKHETKSSYSILYTVYLYIVSESIAYNTVYYLHDWHNNQSAGCFFLTCFYPCKGQWPTENRSATQLWMTTHQRRSTCLHGHKCHHQHMNPHWRWCHEKLCGYILVWSHKMYNKNVWFYWGRFCREQHVDVVFSTHCRFSPTYQKHSCWLVPI